jgi:beta-glucosidase
MKKRFNNGFGKTNVYGALYPFGFGLSYTTFTYKNLSFSADTIKQNGSVTVTVDVTNVGKYKGDEVVQLYMKDETSSVTVYESQLRGFERINLLPGETKTVSFALHPDDFKLLDKKMQWVVEPGSFELMVGSSSEDIRGKKKLYIK